MDRNTRVVFFRGEGVRGLSVSKKWTEQLAQRVRENKNKFGFHQLIFPRARALIIYV